MALNSVPYRINAISESDEPIESDQGIEEDLLEGIDDAEIDGYIMSPYEVKSKTILWEQLNADYIAQQELKKSQDKSNSRESKAEKQKQKKKNQKKSSDAASTYQAKTATEAIRIMLAEKKMSSKINYDVLKTLSNDLFGQSTNSVPSSSTGLITPKTESLKAENESKQLITVIESGPVLPTRSMKRNLLSDDSKPPQIKKTKASKKAKTESSDDNKEQKVKLEDSKNKLSEKKPLDEAVIIESGPVQQPVQQIEEDHDSDEDDEDKTASQLLQQFRGGDDDDDYY